MPSMSLWERSCACLSMSARDVFSLPLVFAARFFKNVFAIVRCLRILFILNVRKIRSASREREDAILINYPLYCPKCRQERLIEVRNLQTIVITEPDTLDAEPRKKWAQFVGFYSIEVLILKSYWIGNVAAWLKLNFYSYTLYLCLQKIAEKERKYKSD